MISQFAETDRSVSFFAPTFVNTAVMTGSAVTITVPSTATLGTKASQCVISATGNFYARFGGGTAAVPTGTITDGTGSLLNPTYFQVSPGQTFSVIGSAGTILTFAFFGE